MLDAPREILWPEEGPYFCLLLLSVALAIWTVQVYFQRQDFVYGSVHIKEISACRLGVPSLSYLSAPRTSP